MQCDHEQLMEFAIWHQRKSLQRAAAVPQVALLSGSPAKYIYERAELLLLLLQTERNAQAHLQEIDAALSGVGLLLHRFRGVRRLSKEVDVLRDGYGKHLLWCHWHSHCKPGKCRQKRRRTNLAFTLHLCCKMQDCATNITGHSSLTCYNAVKARGGNLFHHRALGKLETLCVAAKAVLRLRCDNQMLVLHLHLHLARLRVSGAGIGRASESHAWKQLPETEIAARRDA